MDKSELEREILKEISHKAYMLQMKSLLGLNEKMDLSDIFEMERSLHHEIKRLRKHARAMEKAKKKERKELEDLIIAELNHGVN